MQRRQSHGQLASVFGSLCSTRDEAPAAQEEQAGSKRKSGAPPLPLGGLGMAGPLEHEGHKRR